MSHDERQSTAHDIVLTVDFSTIPLIEIAVALTRGQTSKMTRLFRILVIALGFAFGFVMVIRFGPMTYGIEFLRLAVPFVTVGLAVFWLQRRQALATWDALKNCDYYKTPVQIRLTGDGISGLEFGPIPWRVISHIVEVEDGIVLQYTPVNYVPIMDDVLPAGMDRAALLAQIKAWRT